MAAVSTIYVDRGDMSPRERVFATLRLLYEMAQDGADLDLRRPLILQALDRALSWESQIVSRGYDAPEREFDDLCRDKP